MILTTLQHIPQQPDNKYKITTDKAGIWHKFYTTGEYQCGQEALLSTKPMQKSYFKTKYSHTNTNHS